MGVRVKQYGDMMGKDMPGKSMMAQHKKSVEMSSTMKKADKYHKPSMGNKAILAMLKAKKKIMAKKGM